MLTRSQYQSRSETSRRLSVKPSRDYAITQHYSRSSRLLLLTILGSMTLYWVLFLLTRARSFDLRPTLVLERWTWLRQVADYITPNSLITAGPGSEQAITNRVIYVVTAIGLVALWTIALWLVRPGVYSLQLRWILLPVLLFSLPLILLPAMWSDDLYVYAFYGRMIDTYGANPLLVPPARFTGDPNLVGLYWTETTSTQGPLWLLMLGALTAMAGDSMLANLLLYKAADLLLHVSTIALVWTALKAIRPEAAAWAAVYYGWNPYVLLEVIGHGHSDIMICVLLAASMVAVTRHWWLLAAACVAAGALVKLPVLLLLPLLVLARLRELPDLASRIRALASMTLAAAVTALLLYAPLWGGMALINNLADNPAARTYINSPWWFLMMQIWSVIDRVRPADIIVVLNPVRHLMFALALLLLLRAVWRGWDLRDVWVWGWFVYCYWLAYSWPWYFVPVVPVAAIRGPGRSAAMVGTVTLGALLFWVGYPHHTLGSLQWLGLYSLVPLYVGPIIVALWFSFTICIRATREREARSDLGAV